MTTDLKHDLYAIYLMQHKNHMFFNNSPKIVSALVTDDTLGLS